MSNPPQPPNPNIPPPPPNPPSVPAPPASAPAAVTPAEPAPADPTLVDATPVDSTPVDATPPAPAAQPPAAQPPTAVLPPPVFAQPTPTPPPAQAPAQPPAAPNPYAVPNPYAAPSAYASPNPYGTPAFATAYGYPGPGMPDTPAVCRVCGGFPAVDVTVRGHQGVIVLWKFPSRPGPYCQVCGTATVREMAQRTLVRGWWAVLSPLFTLITLLRTRAAYQKIRQLPPPAPGTHGPQLDPGTPLTKRGAIWMLLLPVASVAACITLLVLLVSGANGDDSGPAGRSVITANGGDCLRDAHGSLGQPDAHPDVTVLPCSSSKAQYRVLAKVATVDDPQGACSGYHAATSWLLHKDGGASFALCLAAKDAPDAPTAPDGSSGTTGSTGSTDSTGSSTSV
ncbi:LppU/SCO3897 family protein [Kitasatospora sp. NBC_01302]|uniref:LppU/SCO3897 family protein n=1 Tax=Kitasatospora sp. NBC_01302 TaxID=2903575 RepID=UPI002E0D2B91|nr:hypothetical protein OG294_20635 [Kitasatospora sp. NBC_01302]